MKKILVIFCFIFLFVNIFSQENLTFNETIQNTNKNSEELDEVTIKFYEIIVDCLLRNTENKINEDLQNIYNETNHDAPLTVLRMSVYSYKTDFQNLLEKCKKFGIMKRKPKKKNQKLVNDDCAGDFNYNTGNVIKNNDECSKKKNKNKIIIKNDIIEIETGNATIDKINKVKDEDNQIENYDYVNERRNEKRHNQNELRNLIKKLIKKTRNLKY